MQEPNLQLYGASRVTAPLGVTLREWAAVAFRRGRLMLISFFTVFLGVVLVTWLMPPRYDARVKIMVKRERLDQVVGGNQNTTLIAEGMTEQDVNSEVELLKSRDLLEKVVVESGLNTQSTASFFSSVLEYLPGPAKGGPDRDARTLRAVQSLEKDLKVEPLRKTKLIQVTYGARDPQLAVTVLQTLVRLYLEKHLAVHRLPGALDFFQNQAEQYRQGLAEAEQHLAEFGSKNGVVAANLEKEIAVRRVSDLEADLRQNRAAIAVTTERIHALEKQVASTPARLTTQVKASDNPYLLQQMKGTLLSLELKRTELLSKYSPDYRPVQEVEAQIAQTREALAKAEQNPMREETTDRDAAHEWLVGELAKARTELATLQARVETSSQIVSKYREQLRELNQTGIREQDLIRSAKAAEENFLLYSRKQEEARISDALDQQRIVNVSVAEDATLPAVPSSPDWLLNMVLAFPLACFASIGIGLAADYVDRSFRTPQEVEMFLGLPVLASLPFELSAASSIEERQMNI